MSKLLNRLAARAALTLIVAFWAQTATAQPQGESAGESWNSFRGPGTSRNLLKPPIQISPERTGQIRWKVALPKRGMSSPIVCKDQVILTGADDESRQIYCLAADTGAALWTHEVRGLEGEPADGTLPRVLEETGFAAPTATTNETQIVAIFATGEIVCVNFKGERLWEKHLGVPVNHYGHSSSLVNDGKRVFVQFDHSKAASLFAFDMATGEQEWSIDRGDIIGWSSPILIENGNRQELVLANSRFVSGYAPQTGERYWQVDCLGGEVAPSPAFSDGVVVVANEGAAATAIDISDHSAGPQVLWEWDESLPDTSSPISGGGVVILPTGFGVVTCLDNRTGKRLWEHEFDNGFSSSPIVVGDQVFLVDQRGKMHIFRLGRVFEDCGAVDLREAVYATPAFANDRVFLRGLDHGFCIHFPAD